MNGSITISHRGYTARAFGKHMAIFSMSGLRLAHTDTWEGAGLDGYQAKRERLIHDIDEFIRLEWALIRKCGQNDGVRV